MGHSYVNISSIAVSVLLLVEPALTDLTNNEFLRIQQCHLL